MGVLLLSTTAFGHGQTRFDESPPTHVIEIKASTREERQKIADMGYALEDVRSDKVYIYAHPKDAEVLTEKGFEAKAFELKDSWLGVESEEPASGKADYHSYEAVTAALQKIERDYSQIASLSTIGRSLENRPILALRLSGKSPGDAETAKLPVIMYMGCHHAREPLSVEVPLMFAQYLSSNYGKDPDVTRLVDSREIYITPMVNPDGHTYDSTGGGRGRMWRKNRRRNSDGTYGVDLNRNYGFQWGTGGSSTDTSSDVYMGPNSFSEPETQVVRDFVRGQKRMTTLLTMHTFSELILYPWGHSNKKIGEERGNAADLPVFEKMARDMSKWNNYTPEQASDLYIASGDTCDWAYGELGIFAFTFELSPRSLWEGGFYPGVTAIDPTFQANVKPLMYMLEYSNNPRRVLTERLPNFLATPARHGFAVASFGDVQL